MSLKFTATDVAYNKDWLSGSMQLITWVFFPQPRKDLTGTFGIDTVTLCRLLVARTSVVAEIVVMSPLTKDPTGTFDVDT